MCDELAWRLSSCSESTGKPVAQNNSETMVMPTELSTTNKTLRTDDKVQRKLAARFWTKIRKSSRSPDHEDCGERTVFHDPRRCGTWQHVESPLYLETTHNPKWKDGSVETRRSVQPWRQQSVTIKAASESRSWSTDDGTHDREKNKQIRYGNDGRNPRKRHRRHWRQYRETGCRSKTETNMNADVLFSDGYATVSLAWVDSTSNQWSTTKAVSKCQKDDQIASRSYSTSRRRRSSRIQNLGTSVSFKICVFSVLVKFEHGRILLQKEVVLRRYFSIVCVWIHTRLVPSYAFEQFKATLEEKHIDPTLQDNVLLPSDFAEYIYHVGSSHDLHSIIQSGLIPGGKDVKKGRHAVFFRGDEAQDCRVQTQLENTSKHSVLVNLKVAQSEGLQLNQKRSSAIILYSTLPAVCIVKVVIKKFGE